MSGSEVRTPRRGSRVRQRGGGGVERSEWSRRRQREAQTLAVMVSMYCRDHHRSADSERGGRAGPLCADCAALLDYAQDRLAHCPYGDAKPTCAKCPTHCYKPAMREKVRAVMRYSGPRMLREHPLLACAHLIDGYRKPPRR